MSEIVISRQPGADENRAEVEDAVLAGLRKAGMDAAVVPHLYYLESGHEAVEALRQLKGPLVVASWLYPRPTRWMLPVLGVGSPDGASCLNMADYCCGEKAAEALLDRLPPWDTHAGVSDIREVHGEVRERWYPVVDHGRCTDCRQCLEFCLFGVYSVENDRLTVSEPDKCKPGCPACARVCPAGAIMFPHYEDDPGIAGAPGAEVSGGDMDAAESLRSRSVDGVASEADSSGGECCGGGDGLDELIDDLDRMDDS